MSARSLRKPPPSPHARSGGCQWCGEPVRPCPTGRKRTWHQGHDGEPECLHAYRLAMWGSYLREVIEARDKGVCAQCGFDCMGPANYRPRSEYGIGGVILDRDGTRRWTPIKWVHVRGFICDHVTPLWTVDRTLPWERLIWFWSAANVQTLCQLCSDAKTALEATQRAKERRVHRKMGPGRAKAEPEPLRGTDGQRLT
jgi:ferredoxin